MPCRRSTSRGSSSSRLHDEASRSRKAAKILTVLAKALESDDLSCYDCLDIGCSYGLMTKHLAPRFRHTLGIEYDAQATERWAAFSSSRLAFVRGDAQRLPIQDSAVDVVICAQVYEHVSEVNLLFSEIWRVLVPGGICFFSGPNKLFPLELHCKLPFVHWLPYTWTIACVRMLGRDEEYDVRPMTLWALRRRLSAFEIDDYTLAMIREPEQFSCSEEMGRLSWVGSLPGGVLRAILPLVPNFNWILRKPDE